MQDIRQHLEGKIIAHYHVLEKGFSHPIRKSCFSLPIVKSLINLINKYDNINAERTYQVEVAVNILKKYSLLSTNINCIPIELEKNIKAIVFRSKSGGAHIFVFTNPKPFASLNHCTIPVSITMRSIYI